MAGQWNRILLLLFESARKLTLIDILSKIENKNRLSDYAIC